MTEDRLEALAELARIGRKTRGYKALQDLLVRGIEFREVCRLHKIDSSPLYQVKQRIEETEARLPYLSSLIERAQPSVRLESVWNAPHKR